MIESTALNYPLIFFIMMGLAILLYAILDGYDLGVGMLLPKRSDNDRDTMIASIGPFWDANETWLVLAIGLLLIAFPQAHNVVFENLYLPTLIMLIGLILRGVSFDFRAKVEPFNKALWDRLFKFGSLVTSLSQGYMIGRYMTGFDTELFSYVFALISAVCVTAGYCFIGSAWLVMKTQGDLQKQAVVWARKSGWFMVIGIIAVCLVNLTLNNYAANRWLESFTGLLLLPIPFSALMLFVLADQSLRQMPFKHDAGSWLPFASAVAIFIMCFVGLGFSFYPFVVPKVLTIQEAAASDAALSFLFYGVVLVLPAILAYTAYSYRVFWGKARQLEYY